MTAFHKTTVTILTYVLGEQQRDLNLAQLRLDHADASTLKTDIERERFAKATDTIRDQITELTAVVADFEKLIAFVNDENAEATELQAAREQVAEAAANAPLTEYVDYAEAADVRQIERELDVWAGDDSDIDRLVAEDDARAEQAAKDAEGQDTAWSATDQFEHDQACEFAQDAADQEQWAAAERDEDVF